MNFSLLEVKIKPISAESKRPRRVWKLWERWKRVAKKIGDIQARVLLILFYFIGFGPFALVLRCGK
jgi:hypothetical protein